jgi:hypothetical protein
MRNELIMDFFLINRKLKIKMLRNGVDTFKLDKVKITSMGPRNYRFNKQHHPRLMSQGGTTWEHQHHLIHESRVSPEAPRQCLPSPISATSQKQNIHTDLAPETSIQFLYTRLVIALEDCIIANQADPILVHQTSNSH